MHLNIVAVFVPVLDITEYWYIKNISNAPAGGKNEQTLPFLWTANTQIGCTY